MRATSLKIYYLEHANFNISQIKKTYYNFEFFDILKHFLIFSHEQNVNLLFNCYHSMQIQRFYLQYCLFDFPSLIYAALSVS